VLSRWRGWGRARPHRFRFFNAAPEVPHFVRELIQPAQYGSSFPFGGNLAFHLVVVCKQRCLIRYAAAVLVLSTGGLIAGCDEVAPSSSSVTITGVTPSRGSIVASRGAPPGVFIDRLSGKLAVNVEVQSIREHSFAQLYVFLLTSDGTNYCGQNLPDMPSWQPLNPGPLERLTITGFQVFRVPCDVVGVRALVHTRIGGALFPPTSDQIVAESTLPVTLRILPAP
jgi:hypothetical protein